MGAEVKAGTRDAKVRGHLEAAYYIEVRGKLHGDCFYGLFYEEPEHRPLTEKAKHYAEPVARLVGKAP